MSKRPNVQDAYGQAMAALRRIDELQAEINQLKRAVSQETLEYSVTHDGEKFKWEIHQVVDTINGFYGSFHFPPRKVASGTADTLKDAEDRINRFLVQRFLDTKRIKALAFVASGRVSI